MSEEKQEDQAAVFEVLASRIEDGAENPEQSADELAKELAIPVDRENAEKTRNTVVSFVSSYKQKAPETSNIEWLEKEFAKYPAIWENPGELKNAAQDIVETVDRYEKERNKLTEYKAGGLTRESYLAKAIEDGAKANGVTDFGKYAGEIDKALGKANADNVKLMYRVDGGVNQQYNLDGFIAEQHHADTFNMEAAAKGSKLRAEVLKPAHGETYGKNSVDIVIRDEKGNIVKRYQSKYGKDAEATEALFEKGDYRGQQKLVPEGQSEDISKKSTETIECDGVKSKPLSKEEAKARQRAMQEAQEAKQYEWNEVNKGAITQNIAKKAGFSAALAVGFQGARILGRRFWNFVTGKENNPIEEDAKEFAESAIKSGASAGLTIAATGGITVAVKSGWLGPVLKSTPVGHIANAVCVGIENAKVLYQFATGKITGEEALDKAGDATCSLVGSLALGAKGAGIGATVGSILGPVGTAIGGVVGGIVGGIAGSTVGHAIWEGGKAIVKTAGKVVRCIGEGIRNVASAVWSGIKSLFSWG